MSDFIKRGLRGALKASGLTKEEFAYAALPRFLLELIKKYLRVEVEGWEHLPTRGPYIVICNHSGYMGFDALMLSYHIYLYRRRLPRIIAHKLWFLVPEISVRARKLGLEPATLSTGLRLLKSGKPLILFPEGEEGNFKPTKERYRLKRFRRGFVRLALQTGVPIIPAVVIGAEETHITLSQVRWAKELFGILIPVPLNVIPLPAKWRIQFLPPIQLDKDPVKAEDIDEVTKISRAVRRRLQHALHDNLKKRHHVFRD